MLLDILPDGIATHVTGEHAAVAVDEENGGYALQAVPLVDGALGGALEVADLCPRCGYRYGR